MGGELTDLCRWSAVNPHLVLFRYKLGSFPLSFKDRLSEAQRRVFSEEIKGAKFAQK